MNRGRSTGDTNMQLKYKPRESRTLECSHDWGEMYCPTRDRQFWFRACQKCKEVEWVG